MEPSKMQINILPRIAIKEDLDAMFLNPDIRPTKLRAVTMLAAMVAGMLTALLAALVPAVQAANDNRPTLSAGRRRHESHLPVHPSAVVPAAHRQRHGHDCLPRQTADADGQLPRPDRRAGWFVAVDADPGRLAGVADATVDPLVSRHGGAVGGRQPDPRAGAPASSSALAAGVSLMFQTAGVGRSNEEPIKKWIEQVIQADAFVFSGSLTSANSSLTPMQPNVGEAMSQVDGVERVVGLRFLRPDFRDTMIVPGRHRRRRLFPRHRRPLARTACPAWKPSTSSRPATLSSSPTTSPPSST